MPAVHVVLAHQGGRSGGERIGHGSPAHGDVISAVCGGHVADAPLFVVLIQIRSSRDDGDTRSYDVRFYSPVVTRPAGGKGSHTVSVIGHEV